MVCVRKYCIAPKYNTSEYRSDPNCMKSQAMFPKEDLRRERGDRCIVQFEDAQNKVCTQCGRSIQEMDKTSTAGAGESWLGIF